MYKFTDRLFKMKGKVSMFYRLFDNLTFIQRQSTLLSQHQASAYVQ